jgi:MFS transporter, DHA3 family, macrolide efflux protein
MYLKNDSSKALLSRKPFLLFLLSQGVSNFGESFRFIAVTMLLFKLTGSGVSAALGLMLSAIPSIVLSPFAGTIGDMFSEKYMLAAIDFLRGAVVLLYITNKNVTAIYLMLVFMSALEMLYSPSRRKIMVSIAGKKGVLHANSLMTGISGAAFLTGPVLAGILIEIYGPDPAFIINSLTYLSSSILILFIKTNSSNIVKRQGIKGQHRKFFNELVKGYYYFKKDRPIKEIVLTSVVVSFSMIAINMAFYPYAFDVLGLTSKSWSMMISIYYGTNLLAMALMAFIPGKTASSAWRIIYGGFAITAFIWMLYGFTQSFPLVLLLQFIEGTVLAICGILLSTRMQSIAEKGFLARIAGINDILASMGRLAGMGCAYIVISLGSYRNVFLVNSLILLLFSLYKLSSGKILLKMNQRTVP